ncbi:MAG: hypothetical protein J07HQX50_02596 [Haloquadratum sp. J07HQX50]|nr:MAG: hypothetical protein J07HQX50_02596 [Haloquadratum sp. J07HQX50]
MQPLRAYSWRETKIYYDRFLSESRPHAQGQLNCISPGLTRLQSIMCRALPKFTGIFGWSDSSTLSTATRNSTALRTKTCESRPTSQRTACRQLGRWLLKHSRRSCASKKGKLSANSRFEGLLSCMTTVTFNNDHCALSATDQRVRAEYVRRHDSDVVRNRLEQS